MSQSSRESPDRYEHERYLAKLCTNCRKTPAILKRDQSAIANHEYPVPGAKLSIPEWIRTTNLRLRRPTLYPVELRGRCLIRVGFDSKEMEEAARAALPADASASAVENFSKLICLIDPKSALSESLRSLRTNIQFASMDRKVKSILFTSAGLGEGKSTCVTNLAITLAQEGQRVLLVDADLRGRLCISG